MHNYNMQLTLELLRIIIKEEVERNLRWSSGFFGGVGSRSRKGTEIPPPGLGTEEEEYVEKEEERRFTQPGARYGRGKRKRHGNARGNR